MTIQEFQEDWGKEFQKFAKSGLCKALLEVIHAQSPIAESTERTAGDVVVAGHVLFAEAKAYERIETLISKRLLQKPKDEQPPDDYKEQPEI